MLQRIWIAFIMRPKFPWIAHQALHDLGLSASLAVWSTAYPMTPDASDKSSMSSTFSKCKSFHFQSPFPNPFLLFSNFYFFFITRWYTLSFLRWSFPTHFLLGDILRKQRETAYAKWVIWRGFNIGIVTKMQIELRETHKGSCRTPELAIAGSYHHLWLDGSRGRSAHGLPYG